MLVQEYMRIAEMTDQLEPKVPSDFDFKVMPILGLAGEIGSLLAELKKRVREPNRRADVGSKLIEEELGDITWYQQQSRAEPDWILKRISCWETCCAYWTGRLNIGQVIRRLRARGINCVICFPPRVSEQ